MRQQWCQVCLSHFLEEQKYPKQTICEMFRWENLLFKMLHLFTNLHCMWMWFWNIQIFVTNYTDYFPGYLFRRLEFISLGIGSSLSELYKLETKFYIRISSHKGVCGYTRLLYFHRKGSFFSDRKLNTNKPRCVVKSYFRSLGGGGVQSYIKS